jgi:uncharacterized protein with HEPN domain
MSKARDWLFRIQDMIDHIEKIQTYTKDISKAAFFDNAVLQDAVVRNLEVIGEAARFVPTIIQDKHNTVEWDKIIGMRHKISHDYLHIDMNIVWNLIENHFFGLKDQLADILRQEDRIS